VAMRLRKGSTGLPEEVEEISERAAPAPAT
jgi:hypothetical protein